MFFLRFLSTASSLEGIFYQLERHARQSDSELMRGLFCLRSVIRADGGGGSLYGSLLAAALAGDTGALVNIHLLQFFVFYIHDYFFIFAITIKYFLLSKRLHKTTMNPSLTSSYMASSSITVATGFI